MKTLSRVALTLCASVFSTLAAAQVTFYEQEEFQGQSFTTSRQVWNFERFGFNDRASSVVVAGNRWEVCEDTRFEGRCVVVRPGSYGSLAAMGLNNRISSVRAVSADARIDESRYAPLPASPRITFYKNERFAGQQFTTETQVRNFERFGFNDRASSVDVVGNRWEVCEDARFRGKCVVLRPGRYPTLTSLGLGNNISSVRRVPGNARIDDSRYAPAPVAAHDGRDYRRRNSERLYEANVTSSRAVIATADQRCWIEQEQVPQDRRGVSNSEAAISAVVGGILGHQPRAQTRDVQKCTSVPSQTPTYWDVTYNFRGQEHRVQMSTQPGSTVTVNERGEPRA